MTKLGPQQLAWVVSTYFTSGARVLRIGGLLIAWKPRKPVADPDYWNDDKAPAPKLSPAFVARTKQEPADTKQVDH